jgi:hypothetical protein
MAASATFEKTCDALVHSSELDKLSARGTIRIMLKASGLDAKTVEADEMVVVVERSLEKELRARGVESPEAVCARILAILKRQSKSAGATDDSPESVFARLGGKS